MIATLIPIWALLALSWNILGGYAGLFRSDASFFGLSAYLVVAAGCWHHHGSVFPRLPFSVRCRAGHRLSGIPPAGALLRPAMLAYPLALLYLFEWGGYQEISIDAARGAVAHMQFSDPRVCACRRDPDARRDASHW